MKHDYNYDYDFQYLYNEPSEPSARRLGGGVYDEMHERTGMLRGVAHHGDNCVLLDRPTG